MNWKTRVLYGALSVVLLCLGGFLLYVDSVTLPNRYGADSMELLPPATWLVALMPIAFGLTLILHLKDSKRYKTVSKALVAVGLVSAILGLVIVGPLIGG